MSIVTLREGVGPDKWMVLDPGASQPASQPERENQSGTEGTGRGSVVEVATAGSQWII